MLKSKSKKVIAKKSVAKVKATRKVVAKKPVAKKIVAKKIVARKIQPAIKAPSVQREKVSFKDSEKLISKLPAVEKEALPATTPIFKSVLVEEQPVQKKIFILETSPAAWKKVVMVVGVTVMTLLIGGFWVQITKGYFQSIDESQPVGLTEQIKARVSQDLNSLAPEANQLKEQINQAAQKIQESQKTAPGAPVN